MEVPRITGSGIQPASRTMMFQDNEELLAARLMSNEPPKGAKPAAPQVRQALSDWQEARALAIETARAAGLPEPTLADPLPTVRAMPPATRPKSGTARPSPAWRSGFRSRVGPARAQTPVTLHFANCTKEKLVTGRSGFAFAPRGATKAVSVAVHTEAQIADNAFDASQCYKAAGPPLHVKPE